MKLSARIPFAIFVALVAPVSAVLLICVLLLAHVKPQIVFAPGWAIKLLLDGAGIHAPNAVAVASAAGVWWLVIVMVGVAWERRPRTIQQMPAKIYPLVPAHTKTICIEVSPGQAGALLQAFFVDRGLPVLEADVDSGEVQLEVRPSRSFFPECAIAVRITPSVAGSNVRLRMQVQPVWWVLIAASCVVGLVSGSFAGVGARVSTTFLLVAVLLLAGSVAVLWRAIAKTVALVTAALRPVAPPS